MSGSKTDRATPARNTADVSPTKDPDHASDGGALRRIRAAVDPNEILRVLQEIGVDARDIATAVGADERTVRRWLGEGHAPNHSHEAALGRLRVVVLYMLQRRVLRAELIPRWLRLPDSDLSFVSPLTALREGRLEDVIAAVDAYLAPPPEEQPSDDAPTRRERRPGETGDIPALRP